MSNTLSIKGTSKNAFEIGDGSAGDKDLAANVGGVGEKPKLRWKDALQEWVMTRSDGALYQIQQRIDGTPKGLPAQLDTEIEWSEVTWTLGLALKSGVSSFDVYTRGSIKHTFTTTQTVTLSRAPTGFEIYAFYFDDDGVLAYFGGDVPFPSDGDPFQYPMVAIYLWIGSSGLGPFDFRRGTIADDLTFQKSSADGPIIASSGFTFSCPNAGSTGTNDGAWIIADSSENNVISGDLSLAVDSVRSPASEYEQELGVYSETPPNFPAKLPIWYIDGTGFATDAATDYIVRPFDGVAGHRVGYNLNGGSSWSVADPGEGNYVAAFVLFTTLPRSPVIAVMGQEAHTTLEAACDNNRLESLAFPFFFSVRLFCRVIFRTSTAYTNDIKATVVRIDDLRRFTFGFLGSGAQLQPHYTIGDRDQPRAHPAAAVNLDVSEFVGSLGADDVDVQHALETLDATAADTDLASTYDCVYISAAGVVSKTDAADVTTSAFAGVVMGSGKIKDSGFVVVKFTTGSDEPSPGAMAYLARADEEGGAAGKLNADPPAVGVITPVGRIWEVDPNFATNQLATMEIQVGVRIKRAA